VRLGNNICRLKKRSKKECCGMLLTNGGRVLGVTGLGATLDDAIKTAYAATEKIDFTDLHKRTDIGIK